MIVSYMIGCDLKSGIFKGVEMVNEKNIYVYVLIGNRKDLIKICFDTFEDCLQYYGDTFGNPIEEGKFEVSIVCDQERLNWKLCKW